jgi:hypothetical protein
LGLVFQRIFSAIHSYAAQMPVLADQQTICH